MIAGYIKTVDAALRERKTTDDKVAYMRGAMRAHETYKGKAQLYQQLKGRYDRLLTKQKKERGMR